MGHPLQFSARIEKTLYTRSNVPVKEYLLSLGEGSHLQAIAGQYVEIIRASLSDALRMTERQGRAQAKDLDMRM